MPFENTEHLSKLPIESIKTVYEKWPSPTLVALVPLLLCIGPAYFLITMEGKTFAELIGVMVVWLVALFAFLIFMFSKLSSARKLLKDHADKNAVPFKPLLKEFKRNLNKISKELKS